MPRSSLNDPVCAEFRVSTPMFLGGADQEADRIRGSAVKGALAFWWRAYRFAHFVQGSKEDLKAALDDMREREKELFGSSDGGQGRFLLRVRHGELKRNQPGETLEDVAGNGGIGSRYLGYGLMGAFGQNAGRLERGCITADQNFTVELLFRPGSSDRDREEITTALKLFGLLGGLGARVRRGWGSVALTNLEGAGQEWRAPASREEYTKTLKALFDGHPGQSLSGADWPLTAFAQESGVWVGTKTGGGLDVLEDMGEGLRRYRAWIKETKRISGDLIKIPGEQNFPEDHDWFKAGPRRPMSGIFQWDNGRSIDVKKLPLRAAFGLPHNYYSPDDGLGMFTEGPEPKKKDRRASPLLLHVHRAGGTSWGVMVFFPTRFLDEPKIRVKNNQNANGQLKNYTFDPEVVCRFLNGSKPDGTAPQDGLYFPSEQVLP